MDDIQFALTPINLALLGEYDDFYELYSQIHTVYNDKLSELIDSKDSWVPCEKITNAIYKDVRPLLRSFQNDKINVFTGEFQWLPLRAQPTRNFIDNCYGIKIVAPLKFRYVFYGFTDFLKNYEWLVIRHITIYKKELNLWAARESVINDVNRHINALTNYYQKNHIASGISQKEADFLDDRIYIFYNLSSISCNRKNHKVIPMLKCFSLLDDSSSISVPVHYCETCHKYFIGIEVLKIYQKEYGDFLILLSNDDLDRNTFFSGGESKLHQAGYNVQEGVYTEKQRRRILIALYESKKLSEFEITRDLHNAIHRFQYHPNFTIALRKWKSDLMFFKEHIRRQLISNSNGNSVK